MTTDLPPALIALARAAASEADPRGPERAGARTIGNDIRILEIEGAARHVGERAVAVKREDGLDLGPLRGRERRQIAPAARLRDRLEGVPLLNY